MELEDAVAVAAAAREEAAAALNAKAWVALNGRGGVGAACRSWAACPGRSASRKEVAEEGEEEEEGRW